MLLVLVSLLGFGCGGPVKEAAPARPDPTRAAWYGAAVAELVGLNRAASAAIGRGKREEAGALIAQGQAVASRVLGVRAPTVAAAEAASDCDQLYGELLMARKEYGWARHVFQKNVARWKNWQPQTEETAQRRKAAEAAIGECDRRLGL